MWVYIKPVTVKFKDNKIVFRGDDAEGGYGIELRGKICAETDDTSAKQIWTSENMNKTKWSIGNKTNVDIDFSEVSLTLSSPSQKFYIWTENMYDVDTGTNGNDYLGQIKKGQDTATRTLSALKSAKTFTKVFGYKNGNPQTTESGDWFNLTFELVLTDN